MSGKLRARWGGGRQVEIEVNQHPTDRLLTCEECGGTCAGDTAAMAVFVFEHTERHAAARGLNR